MIYFVLSHLAPWPNAGRIPEASQMMKISINFRKS